MYTQTKRNNTGFTIVELLVVISIIALLISILVPAINKARENAGTTASKSNLHQLQTAMNTYSNDHDAKQFTTAPEDLSRYAVGGNVNTAVRQWYDEVAVGGGNYFTGMLLGDVPTEGGYTTANWIQAVSIAPFTFGTDGQNLGEFSAVSASESDLHGLGSFRFPNCKQLANYTTGSPYSKVYFASKDAHTLQALSSCLDYPSTICLSSAVTGFGTQQIRWFSALPIAPSSYCLSPAAMVNPKVFDEPSSHPISPGQGFKHPMEFRSGYRAPAMDQAKYASLKTHMMEHHWLQNKGEAQECAPDFGDYNHWMGKEVGFDGDNGDECVQFLFNCDNRSTPVTAFYDGSVAMLNMGKAVEDGKKAIGGDTPYLWHWETPQNSSQGGFLGGGIPSGNIITGGYFIGLGGLGWGTGGGLNLWSGGHIFTMNGIKGRDIISRN